MAAPVLGALVISDSEAGHYEIGESSTEASGRGLYGATT